MESLEELNFSVEDYQAWHRERDIKNGASESVFRNHMLTYAFAKQYIEDRVKAIDKDYNELWQSFHNFVIDEDWANIDEYNLIREALNEALPNAAIYDIYIKLVEEKRNKKTPVKQPVKQSKEKPTKNKNNDISETDNSDTEPNW